MTRVCLDVSVITNWWSNPPQSERMKCILLTATSGLDQAAAEGKLHPSGSVLFEMKDENPSVRREQLRSFSMTLCSRTR